MNPTIIENTNRLQTQAAKKKLEDLKKKQGEQKIYQAQKYFKKKLPHNLNIVIFVKKRLCKKEIIERFVKIVPSLKNYL